MGHLRQPSSSGQWRATLLDAKRVRAIKARLKDGYTVDDLYRAVDGCSMSPYHQGVNESGSIYDDIELICRNAVNVDKFRHIAESGTKTGGSQKFNFANADRSGDDKAAAASAKRHGIVVPAGEIEF